MTTKQKRLRAKVSLALLRAYQRQPTASEVDKYTFMAEVLITTVAGAIGERRWQKKNKQPWLFNL